ncbi:MAG: hypothetical protein Ct9H300mP32_3660 [Verrucomicrobiota bacterium]|nr:MAG: hypothetical protein Ct9H300mP32_3660 [Verrucomicrobiota bacterium]
MLEPMGRTQSRSFKSPPPRWPKRIAFFFNPRVGSAGEFIPLVPKDCVGFGRECRGGRSGRLAKLPRRDGRAGYSNQALSLFGDGDLAARHAGPSPGFGPARAPGQLLAAARGHPAACDRGLGPNPPVATSHGVAWFQADDTSVASTRRPAKSCGRCGGGPGALRPVLAGDGCFFGGGRRQVYCVQARTRPPGLARAIGPRMADPRGTAG